MFTVRHNAICSNKTEVLMIHCGNRLSHLHSPNLKVSSFHGLLGVVRLVQIVSSFPLDPSLLSKQFGSPYLRHCHTFSQS